jgi:hypothetical protein
VLPQWTVKYGPEFEQSKAACGVSSAYLERHLKAIRLTLERDPVGATTPFLDDAHGVIETADYVGEGFILTAFVVLYKSFVVEIKWVETRPLPEDTSDD